MPGGAPAAPAARLGSRVAPHATVDAVGSSIVEPFSEGEHVLCPFCGQCMQAPCVAPAIRCAGCREVIYPCALSTPSVPGHVDPGGGNVLVTTQPSTAAPQQPPPAPTVQDLASIHEQNRSAPLLKILAHDSIACRVLNVEVVGMVALCRLRRASRQAFESVGMAFRRLKPVMLLGGEETRMSGLNVKLTKCLDISNMNFSACCDMPEGRCHMAACAFPDGRVLMAGGSEGRWTTGKADAKKIVPEGNKENVARPNVSGPVTEIDDLAQDLAQESNSVRVWQNDRWSSLPPMSEARAGARAVVLADGRVMVAGGSKGELYLQSAEVLDLTTGTWTALPDMHHCYCHFAMGVLQDGRVIVAGGMTSGQPGTHWQLAEIYDPVRNRWSVLPALAARRQFCAGCVASDGRFVVSGGEDERGVHESCEAYNPLLNCWEPAADMNVARSGHAMCRVGGDLLIAGGRGKGKVTKRGPDTVPEMEVCDVSTGRWLLRAQDQNFALVRPGVVAVAAV
jgi:hypothetical protein